MSIRKYIDWRGYLEGLYLSWIKTVTTTLLAFFGSNGVEHMGIETFKGVGLSWKQAGSMLITITVFEVLRYLQAKPLPETKTMEVNTEIITKN